MLYDYLQILKPQVGYNAIGTLYAVECTTLRLERLRLGRYGLAHLRLLQSRLGRLRLELTHVPFRLVPDKSTTASVTIMLYVSQCRCSCQTFNFAQKGDILTLK